MKYLLHIVFLFPLIGYSQEDTTFTNYDMPERVSMSSYMYESFIGGSNSEVPMNQFTEEVYIIGWTKEGKLAYAVEPPDENCDCYFFEVWIKDLTNGETEYMFNYSNIDYVHGEKEMDSASAGIDCRYLQCAWYSNYQELSKELHHAGIQQPEQASYYPNRNFRDTTVTFEQEDETGPIHVDIKVVEEYEDDTIYLEYDHPGGRFIDEIVVQGRLTNPLNRDQKVLIVSETGPGLNPETDVLVTYTLLGYTKEDEDTLQRIVLEEPPFKQFVSNQVEANPAYRHVRLEEEKHDKIGALADDEWFREHGNYIRGYIYDKSPGHEYLRSYYVPHSQPEERYKGDTVYTLSRVIMNGDWNFYIYGSEVSDAEVVLDPQQLIVFNNDSSELSKWYDFTNYTFDEGVEDEEATFTEQAINWVEESDSILYVSHSHRTYSKSSGGKNAYITAIDLETDEILWRSKPLVSNSRNFELINDVIVTGYGFTGEDDFIYLINRKNGEVIDTIAVNSAPDWFSYHDDRIYVRTYDGSYQFQVKSSFFESY